MLKDQLESLFLGFHGILKEAATGKVDVRSNDLLVSMLQMFGSTCQVYKDKKENNTLRVAWAHFDSKATHFAAEHNNARALGPWFQYIECALLSSNPLPKLQISLDTIKFAEENTVDGLARFFNRFLGSNHQTASQVKDVEKNVMQYTEQNNAAIRNSKKRFDAKRKTVQSPSQNELYMLTGGGQNIEFGSPVYRKKPQMVDDGKDGNVDEDSDAEMGGMQSDEYPMNAVILKKPQKLLRLDGRRVKVDYPFPCQIEVDLGDKMYGVKFASPWDGCKAKILKANVETEPKVVSAYERKHLHNNKKLGYPSIAELDRKKKLQNMYQ